MKPSTPLSSLRETAGFTLAELLVAAAIFVIVALALGTLYVSTMRAFDFSSAQAFVQRQGSLIQEEMMRQMGAAMAVQVMACGPSGASPSLLYQTTPETAERDATTPKSRFRCLYRRQEATLGDAAPKLYTCKLDDDPPTYSNPVPAAGTDCMSVSGNRDATKVNLLRQDLDETAVRLSANLTVNNVTFTQITAINGITVTVPSVDIRFDLTDQVSIFTSPSAPGGLRFGFVAAARN